MKRLGPFSPVAALLLAAALTGCALVEEPYAAKVGGQTITMEEFERAVEANAFFEAERSAGANPIDREAFLKELFGTGTRTFGARFAGDVLTERVFVELEQIALARRGLKVDQAIIDKLEKDIQAEAEGLGFPQLSSDLRRWIAEQEATRLTLMSHLADVPLDEERFESVCARVVATPTVERATELRASLDPRQGLAPFIQTPQADVQGVDLGCRVYDSPDSYQLEQLIQPLSTLQPGQVSEPISTGQVFILVEVVDRKGATLVDVDLGARQSFFTPFQPEYLELMTALVRDVDVKVAPSIGEWKIEPSDNVLAAVVPREPPPFRVSTTTTLAGFPPPR